ncbi:MAG: hypothetical protein HY854_02600 [Burkholderiales bacterium]|nr:hypothetical protein [Burkholderiales bacterium]
MAITTTEQTAILELVVLMFDAAPGAVYLPGINATYEGNGHSLAALADMLDSTGAYLSLHPTTESAASFADSFLTPLGLENDAAARAYIEGQVQAGTPKGTIALAAYTYLHNLPANFPAQYQAAKAIMENKADVAAHYSLVLGGTATGVVPLQQVVSMVTADPASVAAAIDWLDDALATGPELTLGTDVINVAGTQATNVSGTLDGNDDGGTGSGTFGANDIVHGNGNTNLKLTIKESGEAPVGELANIESVFINAEVAGGVEFDASEWTGVGSIELNEGVDGTVIGIDNLAPGTAVAIEFVTGTFEVEYDYEDGASLTLVQPTDGGAASFVLRANGDVVADLGDGAEAALSIDGELGNVSAQGGDAVRFAVSVAPQDGGLAIGDVDVEAGADSTVEIDVADVAGDLSVGDIDMAVDMGTQLRAAFDDVGGDAVIGNVFMHDLGAALVTLEVGSVEGDLVAGDIQLSAAAGGEAALRLENLGGAADIGAVTVAPGGGTASATITGAGGAGALVMDSVHVQAGAGGDDATLTVDGFAAVTLGAVTVEGSHGAAVTATVSDISGNVVLGAVTVSGGDDSPLALEVESTGGNVTTGVVQLLGGDDAQADVSLTAGGALATGNVHLHVGDTAVAQATLVAGGAINAGQLVLMGGEGLVADASVQAQGGDTAGTFTAAGASVVASQDAVVVVEFRQSVATSATDAAASAGDMTVNGFTGELGDNANVTLVVEQSAQVAFAESFVDGDLVVGDIGISASATTDASPSGGSNLTVSIVKSADAPDGAGGAMTVGDITLGAGDDAAIDVEVSYDAAFDSIGPVNVGLLAITVGESSTDVVAALRVRNAGDIGDVDFAGATLVVGNDSSVTVDLQLDKRSGTGSVGNIAFGNFDLDVGEDAAVDIDVDMFGMHDASGIGDVSIGTVVATVADGGSADLAGMGVPAAGLASAGNVTVGAVTATIGEGASFAFDPSIVVEGSLGNVSLGLVTIVAGEGAAFDVNERFAGSTVGELSFEGWALEAGASATGELSMLASGTLDLVDVGNVSLQLAQFAEVVAELRFGGGESVGSADFGNLLVDVEDGADATLRVVVDATDSAGDMTVGDVTLVVQDLGVETVTEDEDEVAIAGSLEVDITHDGADDETLTIGDISFEVQGTEAGDEAWMFVRGNGDVVIGDIIVSGAGDFVLDGAAHNATGTADEPNTSFLAIQAGGEVTIGNVDFSGYENDVTLDLSWVDHGAAVITAGAGDDIVRGTVGNNTLVGGLGLDDLDISQGGVDTVRFSLGDSGKTEATLDDIIGFVGGANGAGDKLDFNLLAGAANNYVEGTGAASYATFLQHANTALNSTVTYFAEVVAGTVLVAVSYGSGEADLVVRLVGVDSLAALAYQNFVA